MYRQENRARIAAKKRADYLGNRAKVLARVQARHAAKREEILAQRRAAYAADPQHRLAQNRARQVLTKGALAAETVDRSEVLRRHDGLCGICGEPVDPDNFHVDHIVPLARGGEHTYANTQPAHPPCNLMKAASLPAAA